MAATPVPWSRSAGVDAPNGAAAQLIRLSRRICQPVHGRDPLIEALALACTMVPAAVCASLTQLTDADPRRPRTVAASAAAAAAIDAIEYQTAQGPGLAAIADTTIIACDFTTETRWPAFISRALTAGTVRAVLNYPLTRAGHPDTTLNLYSNDPTAFRAAVEEDIHLAAAGLALALTAITQAQRTAHLANALTSNRTIAAAQCLLMHRHRWTPEQALRALRDASQHSNRKMRHIADQVLATNDLPHPPSAKDTRCGTWVGEDDPAGVADPVTPREQVRTMRR